MAEPQFTDEPGARNSKRLPVKAKGEVRLRSVLSSSSSGICPKPRCSPFLSSTSMASSMELFSNLSRMSLICVPRKVEMMAGGASFAPRRWAFVAEAMLAFRSALYLYTAMMVFTTKVMKRRLSSRFLPGEKRLTPLSVPIDQLQCLPEPFTPLKGFSCSSTRKL